jgi:hypothetical protein
MSILISYGTMMIMLIVAIGITEMIASLFGFRSKIAYFIILVIVYGFIKVFIVETLVERAERRIKEKS